MSSQDNVIALADRVLGSCPACEEPVLFGQNFMRAGGRFVHVSCALAPGVTELHPRGADFPRPAPPPDRSA